MLADDAQALINAIPTGTLPGLRNRAISSVMAHSFAGISATLPMDAKDVFTMRYRLWLRLSEKGSKHLKVSYHHNVETYLRKCIEAAGLKSGPVSELDARIIRTTDTANLIYELSMAPDRRQYHTDDSEYFTESRKRIYTVHSKCHEYIHTIEQYFRGKLGKI